VDLEVLRTQVVGILAEAEDKLVEPLVADIQVGLQADMQIDLQIDIPVDKLVEANSFHRYLEEECYLSR